MRLGILFGGNSLEHEISIVTAFQLKAKLKEYNIVLLYLDFNNNLYYSYKGNIKEFKNKRLKTFKKTRFVKNGFKHLKLDCVILAGHGENFEDGSMASVCNFYNIRYVGANILASSIMLDKYSSYLALKGLGVNVIPTYRYTYKDYLNGAKIKNYPAILKPQNGGSSIGIVVLNNDAEFENSLATLFKNSSEYVVQDYLPEVEEYNIAVSSSYVSSLEKITKKDKIFSFQNKYNESFKQIHQELAFNKEEYEKIGRLIYDSFNMEGIIRIDFFKYNNTIYVNEVNVIPGALAMYLFSDFDNVILDEIKKALKKEKKTYKIGNYIKNNTIDK